MSRIRAITVSIALLSSATALSAPVVVVPADTTAPTITVTSPQVEECANSAQQATVTIGAIAVDDVSPFAQITYWVSGSEITDPATYNLGQTAVTVQACDPSSNCATKLVGVLVTDTTAPSLSVPAVHIVECTGTSGTAVDLAPVIVISDICDPSGSTYTTPDAPGTYPVGSTDVTVIATDGTGNGVSTTTSVLITDSQPPAFFVTSPPDMVFVPTVADVACVVGTGPATGYLVTLAPLLAYDLCSDAEALGYSYSDGSVQTANPIFCLTSNATTTVTTRAVDTAGNIAAVSYDVFVATPPPGVDVVATVTPSVASGWNNTDVTVGATATGGVSPYDWSAIGGGAGISTGPSMTFAPSPISNDGNFCPAYITAVDTGVTSRGGASVCFARDTVAPTADTSMILPDGPYFVGEEIPFALDVADLGGAANSGVESVTVTMYDAVDRAGTEEQLYTATYTCDEAVGGTLTRCATARSLVGCNNLAGSYCSVPTGLPRGFVDLSVAAGIWTIEVVVTDYAQNSATQTATVTVNEFPDGLVAALAAVEALIADAATPLAALTELGRARGFLQAAQAFSAEHPGHALTYTRQAWIYLDQAQTDGADTAAIQSSLAAAAISEVVGFLQETTAFLGASPDWRLLQDAATSENYMTRAFMHQNGIDYVVPVVDTLARAQAVLDSARALRRNSQDLSVLQTVIEQLAVMLSLYDDNVLSSLYGLGGARSVSTGDEAFFASATSSTVGVHIANTINAQVLRAAGNSALPVAVTTALLNASIHLTDFAAGVVNVESAYTAGEFPSGFDNEKLTTEVYGNAQRALEDLTNIQASSVYIDLWRAGVSLVLGLTVNFSMYEGPTAIFRAANEASTSSTCIWNTIAGVGLACFEVAGGALFADDGTGAPSDKTAQAAECRYNRLMFALADSRFSEAAQLFIDSKCLIFDIYNRYYGTGFFLPTDELIDPSLYGCSGTFVDTFDLATECVGTTVGTTSPEVCNGIDDDGDGLIDEDYVVTTCGIGPCASTSNCIAGVEIPCAAGAPVSATDPTCDGIDDDCDGSNDEDFTAGVCGVGVCGAAAACVSGSELACTPDFTVAAPELCNAADDDCDVLIDEGLDQDRDGFGCEADATGCIRCTAGNMAAICEHWDDEADYADYLCAGDATVPLDCDDFDPITYTGAPEICDYKDNDCDSEIDEGVLSDCGDCDPYCRSTAYGVGGDIPFNVTPDNSSFVVKNGDGTLGLAQQVLGGGEASFYAYIANTADGTVSKIDTRNGREVGRYCSALDDSAVDASGSPRGAADVNMCSGFNNPSRTAVALDGDVFVANRALPPKGDQSSISKIAGTIDGCIDFDNDGTIQTSIDADGDGVIDPTDSAEFFGPDDECILWTRRPDTWEPTLLATGVSGCADHTECRSHNCSAGVCAGTDPNISSLSSGEFIARAVVIDATGTVWLGSYDGEGYWGVDPEDGYVLRWIDVGGAPYGGIVDSEGILWSSHGDKNGKIMSFNLKEEVVTRGVTSWNPGESKLHVQTFSNKGNYGIAIDGKNRVWVGTSHNNNMGARYDASTDTWIDIPVRSGLGKSKGVTVDGNGIVWTAQVTAGATTGASQNGYVVGFDVDTGDVAVVNGNDMIFDTSGTGNLPVGVGVGFGGRIWAGNTGSDNVTVIDPQSGNFGFFPVGDEPYTYSDFTGAQLRTFTVPQGSYGERLAACPISGVEQPVVQVARLIWDSILPGITTIGLRIRMATTEGGLDTATWYPTAGSGYYETGNGATCVAGPAAGVTRCTADVSGIASTGVTWLEGEALLRRGSDGLVPTLITFSISRNCPAS